MLSRLALPLMNRTLYRYPQRIPQLQWNAGASTQVGKPVIGDIVPDSPERDLVNFPRPVLPLHSGKVRMLMVPEEFFQMFYKKTGVTGPYLFLAGVTTFLCSKEWFIVEHEFYNGLSLAIIMTAIIKVYGKKIAAFLDKTSEDNIAGMNADLQAMKDKRINKIKEEELEQWRTEAQKMLFDAKRENVVLQLEAEYRKRLYFTYEEVKKRLEYHVQSINSTRQVHHKHMVNWIINSVIRSISPQQEEEALKKCINDLKLLSANV